MQLRHLARSGHSHTRDFQTRQTTFFLKKNRLTPDEKYRTTDLLSSATNQGINHWFWDFSEFIRLYEISKTCFGLRETHTNIRWDFLRLSERSRRPNRSLRLKKKSEKTPKGSEVCKICENPTISDKHLWSLINSDKVRKISRTVLSVLS